MRAVLGTLGILFIIAWLILWLAVKISFAAIHVLLLIGIALIVIGLVRAASAGSA
ncbi:MAG TPA: hypothetical protein VMG11_00845 [Steroidobacteraceae bacterium]|nr:hypothetical protein [Steroidobacteraceae bacterium]